MFKRKKKTKETSKKTEPSEPPYAPDYDAICSKRAKLQDVWDRVTKESKDGHFPEEKIVDVFKSAAAECGYSAEEYCNFLSTVQKIERCGR